MFLEKEKSLNVEIENSFFKEIKGRQNFRNIFLMSLILIIFFLLFGSFICLYLVYRSVLSAFNHFEEERLLIKYKEMKLKRKFILMVKSNASIFGKSNLLIFNPEFLKFNFVKGIVIIIALILGIALTPFLEILMIILILIYLKKIISN